MKTILCILLFPLALAACGSSPPDPAIASPYEGCSGGDGEPCGIGPTACTTFGTGDGALCTTACGSDDDCLEVPGHDVSCASFANGAQCVAVCDTDRDCPAWTRCDSFDRVGGGEIRLCKPETWGSP
jgi:hypothetical protein